MTLEKMQSSMAQVGESVDMSETFRPSTNLSTQQTCGRKCFETKTFKCCISAYLTKPLTENNPVYVFSFEKGSL